MDFLKLLYDKLSALHTSSADQQQEAQFTRPLFKVGCWRGHRNSLSARFFFWSTTKVHSGEPPLANVPNKLAYTNDPHGDWEKQPLLFAYT